MTNTIQLSTEQAYNELRNYNGTNNFVNSVKSYFLAKGFISVKQLSAISDFFERENAPKVLPQTQVNKYQTIVLKNPTLIKIKGVRFVTELCINKLQLGTIKSFAWVVKEVTAETPRAIRIKAEIPDNTFTFGFCRNCGRKLTDKFSMLTGMGKVCADYYGIPYIKDISEVEEFKNRLDNVIKSIGVKEFWLPKSRVDFDSMVILENEINNSKI